VVRRWGSEVTQVKPGDHVICSWNPALRSLPFYCERDLPILCEPFARNQPTRFSARWNVAHVPCRRYGLSLPR